MTSLEWRNVSICERGREGGQDGLGGNGQELAGEEDDEEGKFGGEGDDGEKGGVNGGEEGNDEAGDYGKRIKGSVRLVGEGRRYSRGWRRKE
jgi:hypothetical protein